MTYDHEDTWLRLHPEDLAAYINQNSALKAQLAACEQAATKADERWTEEVNIATTSLASLRRAIQEAAGCDHAELHPDNELIRLVTEAGDPEDEQVTVRVMPYVEPFHGILSQALGAYAHAAVPDEPTSPDDDLTTGARRAGKAHGQLFMGGVPIGDVGSWTISPKVRVIGDQVAQHGHQSLSGALVEDTAGQSLGPAYDAQWQDDDDQEPGALRTFDRGDLCPDDLLAFTDCEGDNWDRTSDNMWQSSAAAMPGGWGEVVAQFGPVTERLVAVVEPEATGQMTPVEPPAEWCGENTGPDGAVCAQRVIDGVCPDHGEVGPERAAQDTNEVTW